ncbi:MAG: hypothetical protein LBF12_01445 [Christensenellaceae bacterium]|jgi:hypothetical protein|nr:hypothetical protein [Christensenellaceae bacterium]
MKISRKAQKDADAREVVKHAVAILVVKTYTGNRCWNHINSKLENNTSVSSWYLGMR